MKKKTACIGIGDLVFEVEVARLIEVDVDKQFLYVELMKDRKFRVTYTKQFYEQHKSRRRNQDD